MNIYFRDSRGNLRLAEVTLQSQKDQLDFNDQKEMVRWIQLNTGIKVNSVVLGVHNGEKKD